MSSPETLAQFWLDRVNKYKNTDKVAVRQKDLGIWQTYTWDQEYEAVRNFSMGLMALGLQRGDRVAIIGDNDRQYVWAAYGVMAAGGVVVGIFTDVTPTEVEFVVTHSDATFVLAGDQEQCDKLLEIKDQVPGVKQVIYWDDSGMWYYDDTWLMDFKAVQAKGAEAIQQDANKFEAEIAKGQGSDPAMFCYTSGTTGRPKGAILTHTNFVFAADAFAELDPRRDTDNLVSFLPLAWVAGASLEIGPHATHGLMLNFAERPETVRENIREIAPDLIVYNSRLWEDLVATIRIRILDSTWLNRLLYNTFLPIGYKVADLKFANQAIPPHLNLLYKIGDLAVFQTLLNQFGLNKARLAVTGGAALSPDVLRFFAAIGLTIRQIYGSTEVTATATAHYANDIKFESIGRPVTGMGVQISPEGEIMVSGPSLFAGYHKNEEATQEAIVTDNQGVRWFKTGDAGYLDDDGHVIYLERVKDLIELGTGDKYSPQYIEGRLKFSPYISHAMTIGDTNQEYVSALITIDFDNVGRWAENNRLNYTTYTDLAQKPEVYDLIREDVVQVNKTLPPSGQVRRFVLMYKEFDADEGEMTRTRKLRRGFLMDRYQDIIVGLYSDEDNVAISATVEYRDGRTATIDTNLRIESLGKEAVAA